MRTRAFEHVQRAHGVGRRRGRQRPRRARLEHDVPDREVGLGARRPRVGRRRRAGAARRARPAIDRDLGRRGRRRRSTTWRGRSSSHNIVKYGSTILSAAGQVQPDLEQLAAGSGSSRSSSGNISQCTMPLPAVSHCTSPRPKRAVAPSESEWSMKPAPHERDRLEAAVRVLREAGHRRCRGTCASRRRRRSPCRCRVPASDAAGPMCVVARGIVVDVVHAEQERVDRRPLESERHGLEHGIIHDSRIRLRHEHGLTSENRSHPRTFRREAAWSHGAVTLSSSSTVPCSCSLPPTTDPVETWPENRAQLLRKPALMSSGARRSARQIRPVNVVELGIYDGGGTAFLALIFRPGRLVAVGISPEWVAPLDDFIEQRGLQDRVHPYFGVDQGDHSRLERIVADEFGSEPLDLVIDDAWRHRRSHDREFQSALPTIAAGRSLRDRGLELGSTIATRQWRRP